jgi:hypothetical protein
MTVIYVVMRKLGLGFLSMKGYYESELGANRAEIGGKERFYLSYKFITHEAGPKLSFTLCTVIAPLNSCELEI